MDAATVITITQGRVSAGTILPFLKRNGVQAFTSLTNGQGTIEYGFVGRTLDLASFNIAAIQYAVRTSTSTWPL